jgi:flagellar hook-length control protein FliK
MVVVMLIQQILQNSVGTIRELPANLLANLTVGQRVDAVVLTNAMMAELVKLRVADMMLELKTPIQLKQGQTVQLEVVQTTDGKLMLKLVPNKDAETVAKFNNPVLPLALKVGQQLSVEVLKVLDDKRLLLTTKDLAQAIPSQMKPKFTSQQNQQVPEQLKQDPANIKQEPLNIKQVLQTTKQEPLNIKQVAATAKQEAPQQVASKPSVVIKQQFEIDISRLNTAFKPSEKLVLEVVGLNPLAIKLKADHSQRNTLILNKIRQLLPQQPAGNSNLGELVKVQQQKTLSEPVIKEVKQLLQHVLEKPAVVKPEAFKQAIQNSGVFLERQLLNNPTNSNQDFKANLLRLITALESVITKGNQTISSEAKVDIKSLPAQAQSALAVLAKMPQDLSKLPAQIQTALASIGKTPTQLLSLLMASFGNSSESTSDVKLQNQTTTSGPFIKTPEALADKQPQVQNRVLAAELVVLRELLRDVEGVHAKLQFNQLSMLKDPDSPTSSNVWLVDLPLKDKDRLDILQMRIEQHQRNQNGEDEDAWNVQLTLDTQNLGPLQATINMYAENVKVMLCAERPETATLLEENMAILNADLAKLGVNINHLSCRCGNVSLSTVSASSFYQTDSLVDISV